MNLKGKTVFISGGAGMLGRHVSQVLLDRGCARVETVRSADVDLRIPGKALDCLLQIGPDLVIHAAAQVGGIQFNKNHPYAVGRENLLMGLNVLDACIAMQTPKLVIISSCCAYPSLTPVPFREEDLHSGFPEPSNATYGLAKRIVGTLAEAAVNEGSLPCAATVLLANLYGPGDTFDPARSHAIPAMIRKFCEAVDTGESVVRLWGSGRPTRDFLHVRDAAEAIVRVAEDYDDCQPLNVGTGIPRNICETATAISQIVGFRGIIEWSNNGLDGQKSRALDCTKIREELGWVPRVEFSAGLRETVKWYRESGHNPATSGQTHFPETGCFPERENAAKLESGHIQTFFPDE